MWRDRPPDEVAAIRAAVADPLRNHGTALHIVDVANLAGVDYAALANIPREDGLFRSEQVLFVIEQRQFDMCSTSRLRAENRAASEPYRNFFT